MRRCFLKEKRRAERAEQKYVTPGPEQETYRNSQLSFSCFVFSIKSKTILIYLRTKSHKTWHNFSLFLNDHHGSWKLTEILGIRKQNHIIKNFVGENRELFRCEFIFKNTISSILSKVFRKSGKLWHWMNFFPFSTVRSRKFAINRRIKRCFRSCVWLSDRCSVLYYVLYFEFSIFIDERNFLNGYMELIICFAAFQKNVNCSWEIRND